MREIRVMRMVADFENYKLWRFGEYDVAASKVIIREGIWRNIYFGCENDWCGCFRNFKNEKDFILIHITKIKKIIQKKEGR